MARLDGKVALVTGASSGIGEALARELVRRGARVALVARRADRLTAIAKELGAAALPLAGDVTNPESLTAAAAAARARFSRIDVVVANAGFGVGRTVDRLTVDDFRRQFETNVFGVLNTLYATLGDLADSRGVFAVTGSVAGYLAPPGSVPYAMSKFAVRALAQGLRAELAARGIAVVLLSPGFVVSEIRKVDNRGAFRPEYRDDLPAWLPMRADVAARKAVTAIARRRRETVITLHGKALVFLARHLPRTAGVLLRLAARVRR